MATRCVSLLATLLALLAPGYHAFPYGAGGSCPGGMAAVGESHLDFGPDSGREGDGSDFQVAFVRLLIDGIELSPTNPVQLTAGEDHVVTVISDQVPMRGILFREEAPTGIDTTATLTSNSTLLQPALICKHPIVGITHNDNSDKPEISASIRFDEEVAGVFLDVTVVFLNQNSSSITPFSFFAYDRFTMNFGGMVPPATPAPITPAPVTPAPATPAPVTPATPAPVAPMTPAPVTPATPAPVASKKKSSPGKKGTKLTKNGKGKKKKCKSSKSPKSSKTPKSSKSKKSKSKKTKESKECEVVSSSSKKSKTKKTKSPKKSGKSGTKSVKTKSPKTKSKTKSSKSSKSSSRRLRHVR